jgi:lysophospholipase L1-like esterase
MLLPVNAPVTLRETFGAKLRRLSRAADADNPITATPLKAAPAWASGTAYVQGNVVANGGNLYVCFTAGTSAGSGGPSGNGGDITDNTVHWSYVGKQWPTADDATAPTVTKVEATGYRNYPVVQPGSFSVYGGTPASYGANPNSYNVTSFNQSNGSASVGCARFGYLTDSLTFSQFIPTGSSGPLRFIIDGRYYSQDALSHSGDTWYKFDFSTAGPSKFRKIIVESPRAFARFGAVTVDANSSVIPHPYDDDVRVVAISDSIWAGSGYAPFMPGGTLLNILAHLMGWTDPWSMCTGGTGYIATNGGAAYNFLQRVQDAGNAATIATANIVILMGSTNDIGNPDADITAAVTSTLQAIRAVNSTAIIIVFGLWPVNNAGLAAAESAVASGVTAFSDRLTYWFPLYGNSPLPILTGAWNNTANTGSTNSGLYLAPDALHPRQLGIYYLAARLAALIKKGVLPNIL